MKLRRWETWVVGFEGTNRYEDRVARYLTRRRAEHRAAAEPTVLTAMTIKDWNRRWPLRRLHGQRYEIRRA